MKQENQLSLKFSFYYFSYKISIKNFQIRIWAFGRLKNLRLVYDFIF